MRVSLLFIIASVFAVNAIKFVDIPSEGEVDLEPEPLHLHEIDHDIHHPHHQAPPRQRQRQQQQQQQRPVYQHTAPSPQQHRRRPTWLTDELDALWRRTLQPYAHSRSSSSRRPVQEEALSFGDHRDRPASAWQPRVDVSHDAGKSLTTVHADLPGVQEQDITLSLNADVLTISGHREQRKKTAGRRWIRREASFGSFVRRMQVPTGTTTDDISATYAHGVLEVLIKDPVSKSSGRIAINNSDKK